MKIRVDARKAEDDARAKEFEKLLNWIWENHPTLRADFERLLKEKLIEIALEGTGLPQGLAMPEVVLREEKT